MSWFHRALQLFGVGRAELKDNRSPKWDTFRSAFLKKNNECVACGEDSQLEAHHIVPFHLRRDLELSESNLIALCRTCHFYFGHLKDWTSWNEFVRIDAQAFRQKVRSRP